VKEPIRIINKKYKEFLEELTVFASFPVMEKKQSAVLFFNYIYTFPEFLSISFFQT